MCRLIKMALIAMLSGCGTDVVVVEKEVPADPVVVKPTPGAAVPISYTQMQGFLNTNCAKCHGAADFMKSEVLLRRSRVLAELTTKNMPPDRGALSEGDRNLMVNFFR